MIEDEQQEDHRQFYGNDMYESDEIEVQHPRRPAEQQVRRPAVTSKWKVINFLMTYLLAYKLLIATCISSILFYNMFTKEDYQFFPAMIRLLTYKYSKFVVIINALFLLMSITKSIVYLFYGELTDTEIEYTKTKALTTFIDATLALTIFHAEIDATPIYKFIFLTFIKIFHWITTVRIKSIQAMPNLSFIQFLKLFVIITCLLYLDLLMVSTFGNLILENGVTIEIFFLSEYVNLLNAILTSFIRFLYYTYHIYRERDIPSRSRIMFYIDITTDIVECICNMIFFCTVLVAYGVPFHSFHNLSISLRKAYKRIRDLINYHHIMNIQFEDATEEDLAGEDHICIVCYQSLEHNVKKLPCSHMYHQDCIHTWLEQSVICPICKCSVFDKPEQQQQQQQEEEEEEEQQQQQDAPPERPENQQDDQLSKIYKMLEDLQASQTPSSTTPTTTTTTTATTTTSDQAIVLFEKYLNDQTQLLDTYKAKFAQLKRQQ